jgi:hypothetical protein
MAYKDSLFRSLFSNKRAALTLYNALQGTNYREQDTEITINTLEGSMLTPRKNDLSFLLNGKLVVLVEHQSSINRNMPFRFLHPILRLLEGSVGDVRNLYRKALVRLPRPQFIVLYNGAAAFPRQATLRLSDAFEKVEGLKGGCLELVVKVYNINEGRNRRMVSRSVELRGYAYFVGRVQYHEGVERERDPALDKYYVTRDALRKAIQDCRDKNLLVDYWDNLTKEEVAMLGMEWDMGIAMEVEREEAREEGLKEGLETAARNALAEGFSIKAVQRITGLDLKTIKNLRAGGK